MTIITAIERPLYHAAVSGGKIHAAGVTLRGEATISGMELRADADENAFLGKVAGAAGFSQPRGIRGMIRLALTLTLLFALAITLTLAAAQSSLITLGDRCDWSDVTEISAYDFETRHSFALSLTLVEGWRGDSFWRNDNTWNIPADAALRYQVTLRTAETWYTVSVLLAGDFAYVLAFDDYAPGTDVQHPCAAIRLPVTALGL